MITKCMKRTRYSTLDEACWLTWKNSLTDISFDTLQANIPNKKSFRIHKHVLFAVKMLSDKEKGSYLRKNMEINQAKRKNLLCRLFSHRCDQEEIFLKSSSLVCISL